MNARMPGKQCPDGPGGRDCTCCGQPPGKWRTVAKRAVKRRDRDDFRKFARKYFSN